MPSHDDSRLANERAITSRRTDKMADKSAQGEPKWVYAFAAGYVDGRANMTELLGGKGANLAEMASLGLPVPPGFTITTEGLRRLLRARPQAARRPQATGREGEYA